LQGSSAIGRGRRAGWFRDAAQGTVRAWRSTYVSEAGPRKF
jgi:hypothetical protein